MRSQPILAVGLIVLLGAAAARGDAQVATLHDFETDADLKAWEVNSGTPRIVDEGATHGQRAMEIVFDPKGRYQPGYMTWRRVRRDWSDYDALVLDVLNPSDQPISGYVLIADAAWRDQGRTYWNRHNAGTTFAPGRTTWTIPVRGLYRGEAGSRNNDIKRDIDPDQIVRLDFGFGRKGVAGRVVIDHLRLVKAGRPEGVWAFDFGPSSQAVMLGWTAVSNQTRFALQRGFGWVHPPFDGAARDTTFGPMLLRDFCEARGYPFRISAPAGRYRVTVFFENSGYWGGEQAMHTRRSIAVNGEEVWHETRSDGAAHALYRFEGVEPVGVDLWDTYMGPELARPVVVEAEAGREGLVLSFDADRSWGSKVAGIAVCRADDAAGRKWIDAQLAALAEEFRSQAVCLDPPAPDFEVPDPVRKMGLASWEVGIEDTVTPHSVPPPGRMPLLTKLSRQAVRGEHEPFCIAVRPLRDLGKCRVVLQPAGGAARLPARVQRVWYNTSRGFGSIAYTVRPHTLRDVTTLPLAKDVTRELIVTVRVPPDTEPGEYQWMLLLIGRDADASKDKARLVVPITLTVSAARLDRKTDFAMGFFGLMPPGLVPAEERWAVLRQTLVMLREHGMNMVAGGPSWTLKDWQDGRPVVDFGEMDRYFALLKAHGFTKPLNGYGGARFRGLHDRYVKGAAGARVEKESGLSYQEALMRAWRAVDAHARAAEWPTIWYAMCDETRVRQQAERELAFMRMMAKVSAAFPQTVRTSGSYSVDFRSRPTDPDELKYWHQRFFESLDISDLNRHDPSVMAEAARLGKAIHIYNQGRSRYSFGLYQWSEFHKGVADRTQWHLNILHGYQFFDLDGREPDTAMICYGRHGIYPTIHFERCREGAEDFYLCQTLWALLQQRRPEGEQSPAYRAGRTLLDQATASVALNQRRPPAGYDADALKADLIAAIEALAE